MSKSTNKWAKFFEEHPDKVLGTHEEVSGRFGKVTIVRGDVNRIDEIVVPSYLDVLGTNPTESNATQVVRAELISSANALKGKIQIKKSKKNFVQLKVMLADKERKLFSFDEVDKTYNKHITDDEKRAFVYYMEDLTDKKIKGGFSKFSSSHTEEYKLSLMKKGVLFFDLSAPKGRQYQPKFLFISGNLYDKKSALNNTSSTYINMFGQKILELHEKALSDGFNEVWARRLTLDDSDVSMRLRINPNSKFSKNFIIDGYISPNQTGKVESWTVAYSDTKSAGLVHKLADTYSNKTKNLDVVSLTDGFVLWLREAGDVDLAKEYGIIYTVGYQKIYDIGILGQKKFTEAIKAVHKTKENWNDYRNIVKTETTQLFAKFLSDGLTPTDKRKIELIWNKTYNGNKEYDVTKVPIGFEFAVRTGVRINDIRQEKRDSIGFSLIRGSSCLAYGVGVGKTWCGIFNIAQNLELGLCKRPLVVVPLQVYPQFLREVRNLLPQYDINGLGNISGKYLSMARNISDNSISICTEHGLSQIGFSSNLHGEFKDRIAGILESTDGKSLNERQKAFQKDKIEKLIGQGDSKTVIEIDDPNVDFDFIVCDEAHNYKKLFVSVKGEVTRKKDTDKNQDSVTYESNPYVLDSGVRSDIALSLFFITQYIQNRNKNGNCILLTATPFTNNPLEVYSMLALINYNYLESLGFRSIKSFFDEFALVESQTVVTALDDVKNKNVFVGWSNVVGLQDLVFKFIDKKGKDDEDLLVDRPNKIVLPLKRKVINGKVIDIPKSNRISTTLKATPLQSELFQRLNEYASLQIGFDELCSEETTNTTSLISDAAKKKRDSVGEEENQEDMSENNKAKTRVAQAMTAKRSVALSPYLYSCSGLQVEPTPQMYIESSPKLSYVMECIKSVKEYHIKEGTPMSGQVIYMGQGTGAFPLVVKYLVEVLGFQSHEVGFISGKDSKIGTKTSTKSNVQNAFLGQRFIESKMDFEPISDNQRLKVLIGSAAIKEGINLQDHSSVLYNCFLEYNPTDSIQLEGRIWRQGNRFLNVRIVIPLLENSMDVFMLQKLEEKTLRINALWQRDGRTNEIDTKDFDSQEMKWEILTDINKLAKLEFDVAKKKIDNEIHTVGYNYAKFFNYKGLFNAEKSFYKSHNETARTSHNSGGKWTKSLNYVNESWTVGGMYHFLRAFRPDLVPLDLLSSKAYDSWSDIRFDHDIDNSLLNYTPRELIQLMVQFNKEQSIYYPKSIIDKLKEQDPKIESYLVKWDSKLNRDNISDVATYQYNKRHNWSGKPAYRSSSPEEFGYEKSIPNYLNMSIYSLNEWLSENKKWSDFTSRMEDVTDTSHTSGYNTDVNNRFWEFEFANTIKKIDKAVEKDLKPLGITGVDSLNEKLAEIKSKVEALEQKKADLGSEEGKIKMLEYIAGEISRVKNQESRIASSYKARAKQFAETNSDYLGNELLSILAPVEEEQGVEVVEVKEIVIEQEVKSKAYTDAVKRIARLESTMDFLDGDVLDNLNKRISQLKSTLEFL